MYRYGELLKGSWIIPRWTIKCGVVLSKYKNVFVFHITSGHTEGTCDFWKTKIRLSHIISTILHYNDVILSAMASQITSLTIVYSTVYSGADQRNIRVPRYWPFVQGIHRLPVISLHKWPVTWKMVPFDDVTISSSSGLFQLQHLQCLFVHSRNMRKP